MSLANLPRRIGAIWLLGVVALLATAGLCWAWGLPQAVQANVTGWLAGPLEWAMRQGDSPMLFLLGFVAAFVLLSAMSLPGCSALALLAGATYGAWLGTLVVGCASTLGALLSFFGARYLLRGTVRRRWGQHLAKLDAWVARHGWPAVFCLRLVPVLPYPLLNPLLGLSQLSAAGFFWPSLAGLTLGSLPYVFAGLGLQHAWTGAGSAWGPLAGAPATLALIAWFGRHWMRRLGGGAVA